MTEPRDGASLGNCHTCGEVDDLSKRVDQVSMDDDDQDLPKVLIITNIHETIFTDENLRVRFEAVFRSFDEDVSIILLHNFRRARVEYSRPDIAARARIELNQFEMCGQQIKCYFAQPRDHQDDGTDNLLQPPALSKQFLISPPASPPVGWEPAPEAEPVLNYDLLSAITRLAPGEAHELHAPSGSQPGIVVHACEDPEGYSDRPIMQTHRPKTMSS